MIGPTLAPHSKWPRVFLQVLIAALSPHKRVFLLLKTETANLKLEGTAPAACNLAPDLDLRCIRVGMPATYEARLRGAGVLREDLASACSCREIRSAWWITPLGP